VVSVSNYESVAKGGSWTTGSERALWIAHGLAIVFALGAVAAVAPKPRWTDRGFYEQLGRAVIVRDCSDIHCFRPLVSAVLEHLPGPSLPKWKIYAVVANAIGALAVGHFCLLLGLSRPSAIAAAWLSALGTGSLYALFDVYTADSLMYMMGPLLAIQLWQGRTGRAGWIAAVGVFAKEFAAAPLWIFTAFAVLSRRWPAAARTMLVAIAATIVWLAKQAGLMAFQNYRYGYTASVDLLHGGYLAFWLSQVSWSGAAMHLYTTYGALYVLVPAGLVRAGRDVRLLAIAAVPAALAFLYVEQPERALWNFYFIVIPVAMFALDGLPAWVLASLTAACGIVGLRFGAQLDIRMASRVALVISLAIAVGVVVARAFRPAIAAPKSGATFAATPRRFWIIATLEGAAVVLLSALILDIHLHRREETTIGVNQWGFRGPLRTTQEPGVVRIAIVGGSAAFAADTMWWDTIPARLASALNESRRRARFRVDNLAEPAAGARTYESTLRDYGYLRPDVVCILDGYDAVDGQPLHGRRESLVYRVTGYLPMVPSVLFRRPQPSADPATAIAPVLRDGPFNPVLDPSCSGASASYCLAMLDTVRFALQRGHAVVVATLPYATPRHEVQQQSLAERLAREFGDQQRFRYVNLGRIPEPVSQAAQLAGGIRAVLAR
jgi:hypothetical protein